MNQKPGAARTCHNQAIDSYTKHGEGWEIDVKGSKDAAAARMAKAKIEEPTTDALAAAMDADDQSMSS